MLRIKLTQKVGYWLIEIPFYFSLCFIIPFIVLTKTSSRIPGVRICENTVISGLGCHRQCHPNIGYGSLNFQFIFASNNDKSLLLLSISSSVTIKDGASREWDTALYCGNCRKLPAGATGFHKSRFCNTEK